MKKKSWLRIIRVFLLLAVIVAYNQISERISPLIDLEVTLNDSLYKNYDTIYLPVKPPPKPIKKLTQEELLAYAEVNPCYLPLIKDSSLWQPGTNIGFDYKDLFNDSLSKNNTYRNRFLVADLNVLDTAGNNRKIIEIYPLLSTLPEFDTLPDEITNLMDSAYFGTPLYDTLVNKIKTDLPELAPDLINFLEKVWNYRLLAIHRDYSINGGSLYSGGQMIVFCEACGDTLIMQGRFATSAKRMDIGLKRNYLGETEEYYFEHNPIGRSRYYYAGLNTISSKHWESFRTYDDADKKRDKELGGGHDRIVKYRKKTELSNFMSIYPSADYPDAMYGNGIHEVALSGVSRGMLGTANSIGCLRVSDFGAKFLRWWTPQDCKLFIVYDDERYHNKIEYQGNIEEFLPFKSKKEGNKFREWVNACKPLYAKILEIDEDGDFKNGYIIDGYYFFKDEYERFLKDSAVEKSVISNQ
jgi:hypothetical protein